MLGVSICARRTIYREIQENLALSYRHSLCAEEYTDSFCAPRGQPRHEDFGDGYPSAVESMARSHTNHGGHERIKVPSIGRSMQHAQSTTELWERLFEKALLGEQKVTLRICASFLSVLP
jgi:hypothetical protein